MQKSSHLSTLDPENKDAQKEILEEQSPETPDTTAEEDEEEEEEEEEFSFFCDGANTSPIAAEDVFFNGQIKPIYPLFNQDLLLEEKEFDSDFPMNPQVNKVFFEINKDTSSFSENDVTPMEKKPEGCKKSNSTGFSKIWRFKDFLHRSNSDGRDAFVFLNNHETTSSSHQVVETVKVKKGGKKKADGGSAHEVYLKNKAKENDRRKSYLPYRPEVFGFFTNVNGGMTKNVHPF